MATVTGFTAERMLEIENNTVVDGTIDVNGHLILTRHDSTTIDAGLVKGIDAFADPGIMMMWPTSTPPSGWLLCDGSAISRSVYSDLFALFGTTFGNGDGSTTFNLPNTKGKVVVGLDSAQTEFDTLGETGGAKTHTLSTTEIPSHQHTMANHTHSGTSGIESLGHTHNYTHTHTTPATNTGNVSASHTHGTNAGTYYLEHIASGGNIVGNGGTAVERITTTPNSQTGGQSANHTHQLPAMTTNSQSSSTSGDVSQNHTHNLTTGGPSNNTSDAAGGGGAHNNLQPYLVLNFIVKT